MEVSYISDISAISSCSSDIEAVTIEYAEYESVISSTSSCTSLKEQQIQGQQLPKRSENLVYGLSYTVNNRKKKPRWQEEIEEEHNSFNADKIRTFSIQSSLVVSEDTYITENVKTVSIFKSQKVSLPSIKMALNDDEEVLSLILSMVG